MRTSLLIVSKFTTLLSARLRQAQAPSQKGRNLVVLDGPSHSSSSKSVKLLFYSCSFRVDYPNQAYFSQFTANSPWPTRPRTICHDQFAMGQLAARQKLHNI